MKKILLSNKYGSGPFEILNSVIPEGFCFEMLDEVTQENFEIKVKDADYILASGRLKINKAIIDNASRLKMIQRTGVGLDSLDVQSIIAKDIPVYVNQGVNSGSVAEHTILLILACLRNLIDINNNTKNGIWEKQSQGIKTHELATQTVGIIGMGHIGQAVAKILKAFGCQIFYYDAFRLTENLERELGINYCEFENILINSDIITLHCPLTENTREIINTCSISKMKDGVIIVNTARGKLINEKDLLQGIESNKISFAGLDVYEEEPIKNPDLIKCDKIIATPHIAGVTYDAFYRMMHDAMRNIELFDKGQLNDIEQYKLKL